MRHATRRTTRPDNTSSETRIVRLTSITRLRDSRAGSPRWQVVTNAGTFVTEPDAQVGHEMSAFDPAVYDTGSNLTSLGLNAAGRVVAVQPMSSAGFDPR